MEQLDSRDYISELKMLCDKRQLPFPAFEYSSEGPPHMPTFQSWTTLKDGAKIHTGKGFHTKKLAQKECAKLALQYLQQNGTNTSSREPEEEQQGPVPGIKSKNDLQDFCVRNRDICQNATPIYETTQEGPPHTPNFKGVVHIGKEIFRTSESFKTKKDAEFNVAAIALTEFLKRKGKTTTPSINVTSTINKNRLQEFCQKNRIATPEYDFTQTGQHHAPAFEATVKIKGTTYESGGPFATKKEAEQAAAYVAYCHLTGADLPTNAKHEGDTEGESKRDSNFQATIKPVPFVKQSQGSDIDTLELGEEVEAISISDTLNGESSKQAKDEKPEGVEPIATAKPPKLDLNNPKIDLNKEDSEDEIEGETILLQQNP